MTLHRRDFLRCGAAAGAALAAPAIVRASEPLSVSIVPANAIHWAQIVAAEKGFYARQGFSPRLLALQGSAQSIQAAISGQYQIATSQPETFVSAFVQGARQLAAMSAPSNACDWLLVGAPGTRAVEQLKGQKIGLSGLRSSEQWLTGRLLEQKGMSRNDCSFVIAGTSASKVVALQRGDIAAAVLFQPSANFAVQQGLPALARYDALRSYPTILYVVTRDWAAQGDAGRRAAVALGDAHAWLWNPENKPEALSILAKYTKRDVALLDPIYANYFGGSTPYSKSGQIDRAGLGRVLVDMALDGRAFTKAPALDPLLLPSALGGLAL